jgi:hypothetical protein
LRRRDTAADGETREFDPAGRIEQDNTRSADDARRESRPQADLMMRRPMQGGNQWHLDRNDNAIAPPRGAQPVAQRHRRDRARFRDSQ